MTPEELKYVRDWARSGNEPRPSLYTSETIDTWDRLYDAGALDTDNDRLTSAGLSIAALADALEQANEVAEDCQPYVSEYFREKWDIDSQLETMRANKRRLLG